MFVHVTDPSVQVLPWLGQLTAQFGSRTVAAVVPLDAWNMKFAIPAMLFTGITKVSGVSAVLPEGTAVW
jgi:hypothetical protein